MRHVDIIKNVNKIYNISIKADNCKCLQEEQQKNVFKQ